MKTVSAAFAAVILAVTGVLFMSAPSEAEVVGLHSAPVYAVSEPTMETIKIQYVYQLFLLRDPDPAGYAYWDAKLRSGLSTHDFTVAVENSPEAQKKALLRNIEVNPDFSAHFMDTMFYHEWTLQELFFWEDFIWNEGLDAAFHAAVHSPNHRMHN